MSRDSFSFDERCERAEEILPSNSQRSIRLDHGSRQQQGPDVARDNPQDSESPDATQRKPESMDSQRAHYLKDRAYFVCDSELQTLAEIGTFRAVATRDLAQLSYGNDTDRADRDLRHLRQQSLVSEHILPAGGSKTIRLVALTKLGERLLRNSQRLRAQQVVYHGFVKTREAKHDADLYRLYYAHAERITRAGARPTRVLLDYELKRQLHRDLAALPEDERTEQRRKEVAERHGLSVVNGRVAIPDLRVEYETADLEHRHVDLELVTRNYRPRALAAKAKAGFSLYAIREDASRLRRVLDEREITAEILSL
jgi:hypothetical protein